jgi:hypothetical protein
MWNYLSTVFLLIIFFSQNRYGSTTSYLSQQTSGCTRTVQNVTIPPNVNLLYVDMSGAASGNGGTGTPGFGARVQSFLCVVPGSVLHIAVGCRGNVCLGGQPATPTFIPGGYNGGGAGFAGAINNENGGTGGGGASDLRIGGLSLSNRVMVAGGGGGYYCGPSCGIQKGGNAGQIGLAGTNAGGGCTGASHPSGGGAASQSGPGTGGYAIPGSPVAEAGFLGFGGKGGFSQSGGGGGGYYGGKEKQFFLKAVFNFSLFKVVVEEMEPVAEVVRVILLDSVPLSPRDINSRREVL